MKDYKDLTEEQKREVQKAGRAFLLKNLLTGVNFGGLMLVSNVIISLGYKTFAPGSQGTAMFCGILVTIVLFRMMSNTTRENALALADKIKKITE